MAIPRANRVDGSAFGSLTMAPRVPSSRSESIPRDLGREFAPLLARWYDNPKHTASINLLVDAVVAAFKQFQSTGVQPNTQGWCQYQHDLFEQMCSKRSA
jgi:hypothetical protein